MDVNTLQYGDRLIEGPSIPSSQTFPQNVGKVPCLPLAKIPKLAFHLGLAQPSTKNGIKNMGTTFGILVYYFNSQHTL